jgi:hypothetical protein
MNAESFRGLQGTFVPATKMDEFILVRDNIIIVQSRLQ